MTVPKRRLSKMKGRQRRSHYHASVGALTLCPSCKQPIRPHSICIGCNTYRGRDFTKPVKEDDADKKKKS